MATTVSDVLEKRVHTGDAPFGAVAAVSVAAHVGFAVALALVSSPRRLDYVPVSVPVRLVSPGSLARRAAPPAAAPTAPAPAPDAPKPKPVIEKLKPDEAPAPSKAALADPKSKAKPAPTPPPAAASRSAAASETEVDLPSAGNGGDAVGASSFGAAVSSFDADFPFAYYVDQLQSLIGANWLKPNVPDGTASVVAFTIQRSGQVTDVRLERASGVSVFDRAAVRAVYAANPLPPLPPEYRADQLGVHIRFQ